MPVPLSLARHFKAAILHEPISVDGNGNAVMDSKGKHTFQAGKTVMGRVEAATTLHPKGMAGGREVIPQQVIYLQDVYTDNTPLSTIRHGDRLTLPAGYTPRQAPVLRATRLDHDLGLYGWEVTL
jgi:hypothetical protein